MRGSDYEKQAARALPTHLQPAPETPQISFLNHHGKSKGQRQQIGERTWRKLTGVPAGGSSGADIFHHIRSGEKNWSGNGRERHLLHVFLVLPALCPTILTPQVKRETSGIQSLVLPFMVPVDSFAALGTGNSRLEPGRSLHTRHNPAHNRQGTS